MRRRPYEAPPDSIHDVVVMLVELAMAHEGENDGQETAVVRSASAQ